MKKIFIFISVLILFHLTHAQELTGQGIRFEQAANWKEVTEKAKKENKYIFVDCYATWCGPCKYMSQTIFPLPEVGNYFNERFVSVKIQMDRTKSDPQEVKQWYKDAKILNEKYTIGAYPTYLVFSPDGKALHRYVGTTKTGNDFIAKMEDAFKREKQYYTTLADYKKHKGDSAYLRNAIKVAIDGSDQSSGQAIANYYYQSVKDPFAKDNLLIFHRMTRSTKDKAYPLFLKQPEKVDAVLFPGAAKVLVTQVMEAEDIKPLFDKKDAPAPDWTKFFEKLKTKYPIVSVRIIESYKPLYYRIKNKVPEYEQSIMAFMNKYGEELAPVDHNNYAWEVFTMSDNKAVLEEALKWCKHSIDLVERTPGSNYVNFMDTYASILYKLGNKDEALKWEKLALEVAQKDNNEKKVKLFTSVIDKMEKGEKIWE